MRRFVGGDIASVVPTRALLLGIRVFRKEPVGEVGDFRPDTGIRDWPDVGEETAANGGGCFGMVDDGPFDGRLRPDDPVELATGRELGSVEESFRRGMLLLTGMPEVGEMTPVGS